MLTQNCRTQGPNVCVYSPVLNNSAPPPPPSSALIKFWIFCRTIPSPFLILTTLPPGKVYIENSKNAEQIIPDIEINDSFFHNIKLRFLHTII